MSLLLILITMLAVAVVFWSIRSRARAALANWAEDYGYRIESAELVVAFGIVPRESGRAADLVYRVVLISPSGDRKVAHALLWDPIPGPATVVVRWDGLGTLT